jgi:two-component system invasion response regulator UvrY
VAKIIICDDHQLFRETLASVLNTTPGYSVIKDVSSGEDLIQYLNYNAQPEIILLDICMPGGQNGYEIARYLTKNYPQIIIIGFSGFCNQKAILGMFKSGAKGFITKSARKEELIEALNNIIIGNNTFYIDDVFYINDLEKDTQLHNGIHLLTKRELEVSKLLCSDLPYKQIANLFNISPNTLENIRIRIFTKLETKTRTDLALTMMRLGLIF